MDRLAFSTLASGTAQERPASFADPVRKGVETYGGVAVQAYSSRREVLRGGTIS